MTILSAEAIPSDEASFNQIIANEKAVLQGANPTSIKRLIGQLEAVRHKVNSRRVTTDQDVEAYFMYLRLVDYTKQEEANRLIAKGDDALQNNNKGELYSAVNGLYELKAQQEKVEKNIFKSKGTGLK